MKMRSSRHHHSRNISARMLRPFRLLSAFVFLLFASNAFAQNTVDLTITPASTTVNVGQEFTVNINVEFVSGTINVAETYLNFNTADLEVISITKGPTAWSFEQVPLTTVANANSSGHIDYGGTVLGPTSGHPSASFVFLTITFKAKQVPAGGTSGLIFNTALPRSTGVFEAGLSAVRNITDGSVSITNCTLPNVAISNTGTCNAQSFNLILASSSSGVAPFDLVINGDTYNNIPVGGTITTFAPPSENIFPGNPTPAVTGQNDGVPIEVGLKFRASVPGFVKGIRFFRPSNAVAGTYIGKLYKKTGGNYPSETGDLLASATFSSTTGGQWQQVLFSSPVPIVANQTYIASYFSSVGNYATTDDYFLTDGVTSGSLTALAEGTDGPNGVFWADMGGTGEQGGYPNQTYLGHSPNYFVGVIFTPGAYTFDLTSVTDANGCTNIGSLQSLNVLSVDCASLPVTLLNLSATPKGRNIVLRWSTAAEINNNGFEIQRSVTGGNWEGIGFVKGMGNSSSLTNYTYTDENLFPRRYNYRLKQVDIDGRYEYSMVVSATIDGKAEYSLGQNYPNPFRVVSTIQYTLPEASKVNLSIFDLGGRVVKVLVDGNKEAGTHAVNVHVGSLPAGVYYYRMQAGNFTAVKKLVLQQ